MLRATAVRAMEQFQYPEDKWYQCEIDRTKLNALMRRSDLPGVLHVGGIAALLIGTGALAYAAVGTDRFIPAFLLYAWVYCFAETIVRACSHGTPAVANELPPTQRVWGAWKEMIHTFWRPAARRLVFRHAPGATAARRASPIDAGLTVCSRRGS